MKNKEELEINEDQEDLFEHYKIVAVKGQVPLRVDKFLMNFIEGAVRNRIQNSAKHGYIHVNGVPVKSNYKVKPYDEVALLLEKPPRDTTIIAEDIPLNIIFEDEDIIVVNKEAGMVVHPGHGNYNGTLINALLFHLQKNPNYNEELERVGLVHRIDKETSGLLVIAKNEYALNFLAKQFFEKTSERKYEALVWGNVENELGTIEGNIGRDLRDKMLMSVFPEADHGKEAITHYKVLERFRYVTFIECQLETGRTHQIRVHCKYIGHTLFNDERYGGNKILKGTTFSKYKQFVENCFKVLPRQALHAKTLGFIHPTTKEKMLFESELPKDMENCLEKWRHYTTYNN